MKLPLSLALCAICLGAPLSAQTGPQSPASAQPHVVVISLDGLPARALEDPRLPMPTLRALAAQGSFATAMQPINPTVTWPNHTAMVTGVDAATHHVVANGLLVFPPDGSEPRVEPWVDKSKLVHARTLYEAAAEKGLTTAQVDWVAIYGAQGVNWAFGEEPDPSGPIAQDLIQQGLVTQDQIAHFGSNSSPAWRDQVWTDAAVDILQRHAPNLLLLHLLETDTLQHMYAPFTPAAYAAYAYADSCIARVVQTVREAGLLGSTTFLVVSDHGFSSYTHSIHLDVALAQQGLLHKDGDHYKGSALVKAVGGSAELFIPDAHQRAQLVPQLKASLAKLPGIDRVLTNAEARAAGLPAEGSTDQAPQLLLVAAPDYAFSDEEGTALITENNARGQHGYLNTTPEMQALFVASGAHIRQGVPLGAISNLRVAPTIARILGVELKDAQQPPLTDLLK